MIEEKLLSFHLEGVIGDYLDNSHDGKYDLPYDIIEDLSEHITQWICKRWAIIQKEMLSELMKK